MATVKKFGRRPGKVVYPHKNYQTTLTLTTAAASLLRAAERRTGKSRSDLIEHCCRKVLPTITSTTFE